MRRILLVFLLIFQTAILHAQQPDSVRLLIDSALNVMEHRAWNSRHINWPRLRDSVRQLSAGATTYREAFPALAYAFDRLDDKHGWLTIADSTHYNRHVKRDNPPLPKVYDTIFRKGPMLYNGTLAGGRYAFISIHYFGGQSAAQMNAFAQQIQDSLCKNIGPATRGIIVDLRLNAGGNGYPMFQGLANVFGNRVLSEGVDGWGRRTGSFGITNGSVVLHGNHNDSVVLHLARTCGDLSRLPVAVLIGPATGSSGEQLAIAFTSRPNTVLVGSRTAGYVTANNGFELPGKDNGIVIAEGLTRNTKGKLFTEYVTPGIEVRGGEDFVNRGQDRSVQAAMRWLNRRSKR